MSLVYSDTLFFISHRHCWDKNRSNDIRFRYKKFPGWSRAVHLPRSYSRDWTRTGTKALLFKPARYSHNIWPPGRASGRRSGSSCDSIKIKLVMIVFDRLWIFDHMILRWMEEIFKILLFSSIVKLLRFTSVVGGPWSGVVLLLGNPDFIKNTGNILSYSDTPRPMTYLKLIKNLSVRRQTEINRLNWYFLQRRRKTREGRRSIRLESN